MALGGDEGVDREGGGGAQDRPDIVRIGDLVEHEDEPARRQFGHVDRFERPRLEDDPLVHGVARRARGEVLCAEDAGFDAAGVDLRLEALGRGRGGVEADQLPARRVQRRLDAVEAVSRTTSESRRSRGRSRPRSGASPAVARGGRAAFAAPRGARRLWPTARRRACRDCGSWTAFGC